MSLPEPFAQLLREHEAIADVVATARGASEAALQYSDEGLVPTMLGAKPCTSFVPTAAAEPTDDATAPLDSPKST